MQTLERQIREVTERIRVTYPRNSICLEIKDWIHSTETRRMIIQLWDAETGRHSLEFHTFAELLSHVAKKELSNEILFRRFR